ncbi:MAG: hypothetical protein Q4B85_12760 [Lachnospiraceae bacterium]|nr:hypothetical protein [Lachnospiraceae bacterium]
MRKRVFSVLLTIVLLLTMAFSVSADVSTPSGQQMTENTHLVFGSDRHGTSITPILSSVAAALNGEAVDFVGLAGDMPHNVDSYRTSTLVREIRSAGVAYSQSVAGQSYGNHDSNGTDDAGIMLPDRRSSGLYYTDTDFAVYIIGENDMKDAVAAERTSAEFLSAITNSALDGKVLFVMSHLPLHDRRNDNNGAPIWTTALNQAAVDRELVFLWGHNHSVESYKDTDVFLVPKGGSIRPEDSIPTALNFTYMNAGYIGGSETQRNGYMTLITVTEDTLQFRGFTASGPYTGNWNTDCSIPRTNGYVAEPLPEYPENSNLIVNGSFSDGAYAWETSGGTVIADGTAQLASGSNTDSLKQLIDVEPETTYTLQAEVISGGTEVTIGVKKLAGRYTSEYTACTASGTAVVTFTTGSGVESVEVFAEVLRYQSTSDTVILDNFVLVKGTEIPDSENPKEPDAPDEPDTPDVPVTPDEPNIPDQPDTPETDAGSDGDSGSETPDSGNIPNPEEPDTPEVPDTPDESQVISAELLLNNRFAAGADYWEKSGSTRICTGYALLSSGKDTDTLKQYVDLEANTTYTVTADFLTEGAEIQLMVGGYDGKYSSISETYTTSGQGSITFTTGTHKAQIKIAMQVLRYQTDTSDCTVYGLSLVKAA